MEIRFFCPYCGQKLKADDDAVGKAVDCPNCRGEFLIPEPEQQPEPETPPPVPELQPPSQPESAAPTPNTEGEHTCPVCWLRFDKGDIMHITVHDSLRGDPALGEDAQQRFLATRFNNAGQALDAMGLPWRWLSVCVTLSRLPDFAPASRSAPTSMQRACWLQRRVESP